MNSVGSHDDPRSAAHLRRCPKGPVGPRWSLSTFASKLLVGGVVVVVVLVNLKFKYLPPAAALFFLFFFYAARTCFCIKKLTQVQQLVWHVIQY